ncbi:nucleotide disphospho-sugar-binding domain-containing protein [Streptomyces sp. RerS4]|uniref:nucleotide disphospho-sugar-binding domain-containing protein n=1 Tax=Streptomyces sp. RerS4 TaxID=2942449 RepID=UPI00201C89A1|nr:nucleotide disphospho-sugar-binding domain-containing protein [Streptomyces sp. RerS4]UQX03427.1 DUF1205 domain-containing protein [Streptomyces sp. RerS4]
MKVLFVAGPSSATLFALTPLAQAVRSAGHEVIMATTEEMVPVAERLAIPFVTVTDRTLAGLLTTDRTGAVLPLPQTLAEHRRFAGGWFARLAAYTLDDLLELTRHWRPDLVVGGTSAYVTGLLSAHLGVPHVRQTWDTLRTGEVIDRHADEELAPELAPLGLKELPRPDLFLDVCPPSLRAPEDLGAPGIRWVPGNMQRKLEPWMLTRADRPRVCVTSGSRVAVTESQEFLRNLARSVRDLDVEIVVPAPEEVAGELRATVPDVRTGWIPLDVLAPTCDVILHHGGGVTAMTALHAGVPQLVLPSFPTFGDSWARLADSGAAEVLMPQEQSEASVIDACRRLLTRPEYRERAAGLSREIGAMPGPAAYVARLEGLAAR